MEPENENKTCLCVLSTLTGSTECCKNCRNRSGLRLQSFKKWKHLEDNFVVDYDDDNKDEEWRTVEL